jgi:hypothetical protein
VVSYFLRYFSSTSTEQISPIPPDPFTSFDPVGFAIFATLSEQRRLAAGSYASLCPEQYTTHADTVFPRSISSLQCRALDCNIGKWLNRE